MTSELIKITQTKIGPVVGNLPKAKEYDQQQIKFLVLNNNQHLQSTLYRVQKGWIIQFHIGPSLFGKSIAIFTNHPESVEKEFDRNSYQQLKLKNTCDESKDSLESTTLFASLLLHRAGTFHYYFTDSGRDKKLGSGYFIVDPVLSVGLNDVVPLDSIRCQTILAKSLGTFDKWEDRLRVSKESGYNMVHFTPLQELGGSNSSYSLKDQLKLNPTFSYDNCTPAIDDVVKLINKMKKEWKVLSMGDIVLNHTANESPWLLAHPECTYNMKTAPHLIPAAILDGYLHVFTLEVARGKFENRNIPKEIYTNEHLSAIKNYLETELVPRCRLHEFYTADPDQLGQEFLLKANGRIPSLEIADKREIVLQQRSINGRNQAKVDLELALKVFNTYRKDAVDEESRLAKCVEDFKKRIMELNSERNHEINLHLAAAVSNCIANMRYFRVHEGGPKIRNVSESYPLVPRYFTGEFPDYESVEKIVLNSGHLIMAHNGWVMNSDPLKNFAEADSNVYLRRELIAWGDSVKLRYGDKYSDCPFLWDHMRHYVEMAAKMFDGIRLDNCHSTPLPAAEYLLDCARKIRPDLYVAAELFTNSDTTDNIFVNRLGITSLIREAMSAWDSHELGRQVHRFGGEPVGSFCKVIKSPLVPSVAHALFYDATHDNPSAIEKKSVFDLIPSAGLVSMACCATGSTRGYDELVPHHVHVVDEKRVYPSWTEGEITNNSLVNIKSGIICVKNELNKIHGSLGEEGFCQLFVDQMNENIVAVTRHNPYTHENVIMVAHTAFSSPSGHVSPKPNVRNLKLEGELYEILLEANLLSKNNNNIFSPPKDFQRDKTFINGLMDYEVKMKQNITLEESTVLKRVSSNDENISEFEFCTFFPGSVVILRVRPHSVHQPALSFLRELNESYLAFKFDSKIMSIVTELNLTALNHALYRCAEEESEEGRGCYNVPEYGNLVYCGLQGFESVLEDIRTRNDLGHPFCDNLRQGDWMLDYIINRLRMGKGTQKLGLWFEEVFEKLRRIPRYLIPRYFDINITSICRLLLSRAAFQMSDLIRDGPSFVRQLAMGSVQCVGYIESAPLPSFSPKLMATDDERRNVVMCAGLPHFTTGYMRSWGRDTFISLRGLLLLTGRFEEAKWHILGYAACLRHGLIPNLLDKGVNARYNCRDAVWWWLHSVTSYIDLAPKGKDILEEPVSRMFPKDDSPAMGPGIYDQPLHSVMQEALNIHFSGLSFRERNAGPGIDAHMTDEGFNNQIGVDMETGFVFGGNEFNCGTWMDKMGSDPKSGNRGKPATPRDGSAVEIVALCYAVVRKLGQLNEREIYPYSGVEKKTKDSKTIKWSFKEWAEKIGKNFEKYFWISETPPSWERRPDLIHRKEIYKDSVGASQPWADYQLRCNFLVALVVAPEIVEPTNAWKSIRKAEQTLLGPLGMKTLDPSDWNYNGDYHNNDDSGNPKVAHGFNYHQGPEWLWPVGYFLRAKISYAKLMGEEELKKALSEAKSYLGNHYNEIQKSPWRGLPELTNKNGAFCSDGCRVQAWSMGCILEVLYDICAVENAVVE